MPLWPLFTGGKHAPNLGVKLEGTVPWRPLGKSCLTPAPWSTDSSDDSYLPTVLSVKAAQVGLEKATEPYVPFPDDLCDLAEQWINNYMKSVWIDTPDDYLITIQEATELLKRDKSPGFPYYYKYTDKGAVIDSDDMVEVIEKVNSLLNGEEVPCYFTLTEKSELRPVEKVKANKTRIFFASDIHHLITSKVLFDQQNEQLMDRIGDHPITLGISMPGPQFVRALTGLVSANDGDLSGCDLRYNLRVARIVRNLRANFLPERYRETVFNLYNSVYCGYSAGLGGLYRVFGNKSGWENTATDNSFMLWICLVIASYRCFPDKDPKDVFVALINGDDLVVKMLTGQFKILCDYLKQHNTVIEANNWDEQPVKEITFLSHHLETRYVRGFGDFILAAGNLPKLLSSINWIKKSSTLSFEESCVAHLVGVRLCLFPWAIHFEEADRLLSVYLKQIVITPFIKTCLHARLSETEMARLHTRAEGVFFFLSSEQIESINLVLKGFGRQIKTILCYENDSHPHTKSPRRTKTQHQQSAQFTTACSSAAASQTSKTTTSNDEASNTARP